MALEKDSITSGSRLGGALAEAENIIEGARKRASEIISEAEAIKASAHEEGYKAGFDAAQNEVAKVAVRLVEDTERLHEIWAQEAAKLALSICSRILSEEVKTHPEVAKQIALKALHESVIGDSISFTVHPDDVAMLESSRAELERATKGVKFSIVSDQALVRGGCRVSTEFGEVDASINSLLETVRERLGLLQGKKA